MQPSKLKKAVQGRKLRL